MNKKENRLTVRLNNLEYELLEDLSDRKNMTKSMLVRTLIKKDYLKISELFDDMIIKSRCYDKYEQKYGEKNNK